MSHGTVDEQVTIERDGENTPGRAQLPAMARAKSDVLANVSARWSEAEKTTG
ncbi:hypothetical protein GCM10025858_02360 [Alicyclobacillus sacchari]|nr:hypothetical protein GCM10025858_02360 [Alicyclobacillus sacchari]